MAGTLAGQRCRRFGERRLWAPAYDGDGQIRDGAWVTELTDLLDLTGWPKGMRVIARKEGPHPVARLRITDADVRDQHHPRAEARRDGNNALPAALAVGDEQTPLAER